ncbi:MAG: hypothetical protein AMXMBFR84_30000 [Candidatus Hydrogenedentota bacterium]
MGLLKKSAFWLAVLAVSSSFAFFFMTASTYVPNDDAYITFRVAWNLFDLGKPVFNAHETVEASSTPLYTWITALGFLFVHRDHIAIYALAVNVMCMVGAALAVRKLGDGRGVSGWVLALLLSITPAVAYWAASGMETVMVLMIQLWYWWAVHQTDPENGDTQPIHLLMALTALSVLARADGFVMPLIVCVYLVLNVRIRPALAVLGSLVFAQGAITIWRMYYYGWPLPNTVYAKVSGTFDQRIQSALSYVEAMFIPAGMWLPIVALFGLLVSEVATTCRVARQARFIRISTLARSFSFPSFFFPLWITYWFLHGGDIYNERLLLILYPMGYYALLRIAAQNGLKPDRLATFILGAMAFVVVSYLPMDINPTGTNYFDLASERRLPIERREKALADILVKNHPQASSIAADKLGMIAYYLPSFTVIDMFGLADEHIAHLEPKGNYLVGHVKFDTEYVLKKRMPDFVFSMGHLANQGKFQSFLIYDLTDHALERNGYRLGYASSISTHRVLDLRGRTREEALELVSSGTADYNMFVFYRDPGEAAIEMPDSPAGESGVVH